MRMSDIHSHLNGREFVIVNKPELWAEIKSAVRKIDPTTKNNGFVGHDMEAELIRMGWRKRSPFCVDQRPNFVSPKT